MTAAAVAAAIAAAYPIVDSITGNINARKAAEIRNELNKILAQYNVKISDLRSGLEKRGIKYNNLMDKLGYTSPAGRAHQIKNEAEREYAKDVEQTNKQINELQRKSELIATEGETRAAKTASRNPLTTILGEVIK